MNSPMTTMALILAGSLIATGLAAPAVAGKAEVRQVQVLGRTWTVTADPKQPGSYVAWRDNNNLNPYGKPVARRTPQAVRALELATGCRVVPGSLRQNVAAEYRAVMACGN